MSNANANANSSLTTVDENGVALSSSSHPKPNSNLLMSPSEWLNAYNRMLDMNPLRTKMITASIVSAFGSALGSYISSENDKGNNTRRAGDRSESIISKINWVDVLSYAIHGGLINAPLSHYWFEWLSANGPSSNTASVLVDQLVVQPPLLVLMFVCLDVCRANIRATIHQFREARVVSNALTNVGPTVVASWRFWPFAVYLTFKVSFFVADFEVSSFTEERFSLTCTLP